MKAISKFDKIYIYRQFVDFRKNINGLSTIVASEMGLDLRCSFFAIRSGRI